MLLWRALRLSTHAYMCVTPSSVTRWTLQISNTEASSVIRLVAPLQVRYKSEMAKYKAKMAGEAEPADEEDGAEDAEEDAEDDADAAAGAAVEDAAHDGAVEAAVDGTVDGTDDQEDREDAADAKEAVKKEGVKDEDVKEEPIEDLLQESD